MADFNPFKGMKGARTTKRGQYFEKGLHRCAVKELKFVESGDPARRGTVWFVAEFEILASTAHKVGETRTYMQDMSKPSEEGAKGAVRDCLAAIMQLDLESMSDEEAEETLRGAMDDSQPLAGYQVDIEASTIRVGKLKDKDFTLLHFSPVGTLKGLPK